jgi:hypothetical protein
MLANQNQRIAHGSNVLIQSEQKLNVFGEDLSCIIPAKIYYNEPSSFRGEDPNVNR